MTETQAAGDPYDAVWAVFDRDSHKRLQEAFSIAQSHGVRAAYSNPCFELWFLLHFRYSSAELSPGAVIKALDCADCIPGYSKSMAGIYTRLQNARGDAADNAAKLRAYHLNAGNGPGANPSTTVDELVECIVELGQGQGPA